MSMETAEKLSFFRELIFNSDGLYSWCYNADGTLLFSNAEQLDFCQLIFSSTRCLEKAMAYSKTADRPIMLSIGLGLVWIVDFQRVSDNTWIHVLGPAFNREMALRDVILSLEPYKAHIGGNYSATIRRIQQFPVVALLNMERCAVMLHYSLTGEKIHITDIDHVRSSTVAENESRPFSPPDKHWAWKAETALLRMVREGDLGYQDVLTDTMNIRSQMECYPGTPIEQARISQIIFTALCTRAAIEGGMSPEASYRLGERYIHRCQSCISLAEIQTEGYSMYGDFIRHVHALKNHPRRSPAIQNCCDYILAHVEEPLSIDQLAAMAGYSNYYFSRIFKREMGCPVSMYIKAAKVERAKLLLESSDLGIQQIADRLSMCSRTYFHDVFSAITGYSPAEYRKKHKN